MLRSTEIFPALLRFVLPDNQSFKYNVVGLKFLSGNMTNFFALRFSKVSRCGIRTEAQLGILGMEDRLGSPLGIAGFWTLGMEDRLGSPLGIAGF